MGRLVHCSKRKAGYLKKAAVVPPKATRVGYWEVNGASRALETGDAGGTEKTRPGVVEPLSEAFETWVNFQHHRVAGVLGERGS